MIKNNKGYMLVEIILASAIAFGIAYFIIDLTIKLKNKNDDLMVETLMNTDKTIITNKLMTYMIEENENFSCSNLLNEGNTIIYNGEVVDVVNDYATIDSIDCSNTVGKISIKIPTTVVQMKDQNFDIVVDYKYKIGDMTPPTCSLSVGSNNVITANYSDNDDGSGIAYYGWDKNYEGENSNSKSITNTGEYVFYVTDKAGNSASCKRTIINTTYTVVSSRPIYVPYCTYGCYKSSMWYSQTVRWCINPDPIYCGQTASWYAQEGSNDTYGYVCQSGYTKLNNTYCYK